MQGLTWEQKSCVSTSIIFGTSLSELNTSNFLLKIKIYLSIYLSNRLFALYKQASPYSNGEGKRELVVVGDSQDGWSRGV